LKSGTSVFSNYHRQENLNDTQNIKSNIVKRCIDLPWGCRMATDYDACLNNVFYYKQKLDGNTAISETDSYFLMNNISKNIEEKNNVFNDNVNQERSNELNNLQSIILTTIQNDIRQDITCYGFEEYVLLTR
jgi:hypothetical protein